MEPPPDDIHAARYWRTRGAACLDAAARLDEPDAELAWPRAQLLVLALESALKSFLCSARGGAPGTRDLNRLLSLASHCDLRLSERDRLCILAVAAWHGTDPAPEPGLLPAVPEVARVCHAITPHAAPPA